MTNWMTKRKLAICIKIFKALIKTYMHLVPLENLTKTVVWKIINTNIHANIFILRFLETNLWHLFGFVSLILTRKYEWIINNDSYLSNGKYICIFTYVHHILWYMYVSRIYIMCAYVWCTIHKTSYIEWTFYLIKKIIK